MPRHQCPSCGCFLAQDLVEGLDAAPQPCPHCEDEMLDANTFDAEGADGADGAASVRPPDLAPDEVRGADRDLLAGWDVDADVAELTAWQTDRAPFPTDLVVVVAAKTIGAALGAAIDRRPLRGFVLGAGAGLVVAVVARRVWRLDP